MIVERVDVLMWLFYMQIAVGLVGVIWVMEPVLELLWGWVR